MVSSGVLFAPPSFVYRHTTVAILICQPATVSESASERASRTISAYLSRTRKLSATIISIMRPNARYSAFNTIPMFNTTSDPAPPIS